MAEFAAWIQGSESTLQNAFKRDKFSGYLDYLHFETLLESFPRSERYRFAEWSRFGVDPASLSSEPSLWFGSEGAKTQLHQDAYGVNIVAQLYGKKRWVLFPPSASEYLYPTRVPYEESSTFGSVNLDRPDRQSHPRFTECDSAREAVLCPGDVLFVPKHWWHHVECLETSVSINQWIDKPSDAYDRVCEAVVCAVVNISQDIAKNNDALGLFGPTETPREPKECIEILEETLSSYQNARAVHDVGKQRIAHNNREREGYKETSIKEEGLPLQYLLAGESRNAETKLEDSGASDARQHTASVEGSPEGNSAFTQRFIQALTKPDVVDAIVRHLL
ncbi:hypothetical protein CYMTET_5462 [Cymbomonas tetramitiformis]|uniref:JmjC domain-containing protein n=1 Tax=Cymbomonas tetramitiformis TaxID=36881 RepID=A0AAE0LIU9_9CHLO|nr:hypothetical protein CYMTET_5462 [Cymbomonas tetramitiformis]|eukprot:gene3120-3955_t